MQLSTKNWLYKQLQKWPWAEKQVVRTAIHYKYGEERNLIEGKPNSKSEHTSIIHFSVNKSATQFVKSILKKCGDSCGMKTVGLNDYAFNTNFPYLDSLSADDVQKYKHVLVPKGYIYSVFGGAIEGVPELSEFKLLLMVRDPRDVLVSSYYSIKYSHRPPSILGDKRSVFDTQRERAKSETIDEYVIRESVRICTIYERYIKELIEAFPNTHITKYEHMNRDFRGWLNTILDYCDLSPPAGVLEEIITDNEKSRPKSEDVSSHNRKGIVGDFRNKLTDQTIDSINQRFKPVMLALGYEE